MKAYVHLAVVTAALLAGASVAAAASHSAMSEGSSTKSGWTMPHDSLALTSKQQRAAWQDIVGQATKEKVPAKFRARIGTEVPSTLMTYPVPMTTSSKVPELRRYQYALLMNNKLLIINPQDNKIAEVITR